MEHAVALLVPGDLDQMLDNLLANALDASPEHSRIRVESVSHDQSRLELHVIDEGPGLTEEDRHRAFDRFWQGPGAKGGHSGLGLAIVQQLAERNHATIELHPSRPKGLDAVIRLATANLATRQTPKTRTRNGDSHLKSTTGAPEESALNPALVPAVRPSANPRPRRAGIPRSMENRH
jgi:hypothetical protein